MGKFIRAIRDVHINPMGRQRAQELINGGDIKVFFMEWHTPIDPANIDGSFPDLNKQDAQPSLKVLAQNCLSKGVKIVACDLTKDETVDRLNARPREVDKYAGTYKDSSAFMPYGRGIRDQHAAETVCRYMVLHPEAWGHALLMFGAAHFRREEDRGCPSLHQLIDMQLGAFGCVHFEKLQDDVVEPQ
jgi:hypothetical protein